MNPDSISEQARRSVAVAKKDVLIYYSKGPVLIFGLIMPLFLFMAFYLGNPGSSLEYTMARLTAMTVFFTAAAVSPVIVPLEAMVRTLERLVVSPVATWAILLGDVLASFAFCAGITGIMLIIGLISGVNALSLAALLPVALLGALCFSAMGLLYSAPRFNAPSDVMMIASLVKFSLVFVSGVFIPLEVLPVWGQAIAMVSPLTYFMDLVQYLLQGSHYLPVVLDLAVLIAATVLFFIVALAAHRRTMPMKM